MATHPQAPARLSFATRIFYGVGSAAFGVKDNGFSYFLAFFYAQVVGLPPAKVGLAIMVALLIDAFIDPVLGQLSDNTRSRWGRRHPFMYAAALPVAVSYLFLWNPPVGWSENALIAYLIVAAILIRTFISAYEIPSAALAPELTADYDERTRLLSYRFLFAWLGGLATYAAALTFFLRPTAEHPVGQLNPDGYANYGLFAAAVMFITILISAIGTHREIKRLPSAPHEKISLGRFWAEMGGTLANRSFLMVLGAAFFLAMAVGLGFAISLYFATFYWEFSAWQIAGFTGSSLLAAVIAFTITPHVASRFDKRPASLALVPVAAVFVLGPVVLRLLGLMPPNGSGTLYATVFAANVIGMSAATTAGILFTSMIADVVEDAELKTGRRQEGLFFAAAAFVNKAVSGLGIFGASLIVGAIRFPRDAAPGRVDPEILRDLALVYVPVQVLLYGLATLFLLGYGITRASHAETLRQLAARAELVREGAPTG
ncbi:MFS transporter [Phenylobacterium sp. VNQ135]|uniref:MFS transporter n=1 Tax=Phenylobacterium sp. VNQ135 TaxID=3400922 RepID=UPI003C09D3A0